MAIANFQRKRPEIMWDYIAGAGASLVAFAASLVLGSVVRGTTVSLFLAAVALVAWRRNWRSGVVATATGVLGLGLLLPPRLSLHMHRPTDVVRLTLFAATASLICGIAFINNRRFHQLRIVERKWRDSERWLQTAQQFTRFWTWEIDARTGMVSWADPYGELRSWNCGAMDEVFAPLHPEDRIRLRNAVADATHTGMFSLQVRATTREGEKRLLIRGMTPDDQGANPERLIGISVELERDSGAAENTEMDLVGIDDLLDSLEQSAKLDPYSRLNIGMARQVLGRLRSDSRHLSAS